MTPPTPAPCPPPVLRRAAEAPLCRGRPRGRWDGLRRRGPRSRHARRTLAARSRATCCFGFEEPARLGQCPQPALHWHLSRILPGSKLFSLNWLPKNVFLKSLASSPPPPTSALPFGQWKGRDNQTSKFPAWKFQAGRDEPVRVVWWHRRNTPVLSLSRCLLLRGNLPTACVADPQCRMQAYLYPSCDRGTAAPRRFFSSRDSAYGHRRVGLFTAISSR